MDADLIYVLRNLPNHEMYYVQGHITSRSRLRIKQLL